jgi:non-canonical poly(A) RNA polymerase PAPD5/7
VFSFFAELDTSRFHKEIADFFEFVRPHAYEEAVRRTLITRVQQAVRAWAPEAKDVEIKSFGSFAAGLYLPTADMDLVAVSPRYLQSGQKVFCQSNSKMHKLGQYLQNRKVAMDGTLTVITKAKVPIIKFTDRDTDIKVDISFENDTGLVANKTFAEWKEKYPAMPVIVVLIKQMLAMRGLNEVYLGGLGGFSIICLVVSMMQHMPELQSGNMDAQLHYGELLLNFLDLYGNKFNLQSTGITMNPPSYYDKIRHPRNPQNDNTLTIIDPNKHDNDISGGSKKIQTVFSCFRTAHSEIQRRLAQIHSGENIEDSILGCIWGGNYTSFIQQRNKLDLVSRGISLSPPSSPEREDSESEFEPEFVPEEPKMRTRNNRGGRRAKGNATRAPSNLPGGPRLQQQTQQGSRFNYPVPQRSAPNGSYGGPSAYNAPGPKRYVALYVAPSSSLSR